MIELEYYDVFIGIVMSVLIGRFSFLGKPSFTAALDHDRKPGVTVLYCTVLPADPSAECCFGSSVDFSVGASVDCSVECSFD